MHFKKNYDLDALEKDNVRYVRLTFEVDTD